MSRVVSYFSGGIPSAVATKLAIASGADVTIYNFEIAEEHPDNKRFLAECQDWFGQEIITVGNDEFDRSAHRVFRDTGFLVGPSGARCTGELKKAMRWQVGKPDDVIVMGYTREESHRPARLLRSEPLLQMWNILIERDLGRDDVMAVFRRTGIEVPAMYRLGYKNNNCIGCVKGGAGYWNKIRVDFPERFAEMAAIERKLNRQICKREWVDANGNRQLERIFLDELPADLGDYPTEQEAQCGIFCQMAEQDMEASA
mgnify:CR=1 FL=1